MNPITLIDDWLLAGHQYLVDLAQKQPRWCALQALYGFAVVFFVRAYFEGMPAWILALNVAVCGLMYWYAKYMSSDNQATISTTARYMSIFFLILSFTWLFTSTSKQLPVQALRTINDVLMMMFYYFLGCRPPKPRVPKRKLVPSTSMT